MDIDELTEAGDSAIFAAITVHARGAGSGIQVNQRFFHLFDLRNGKVSRQLEYVERGDALEAAGLTD